MDVRPRPAETYWTRTKGDESFTYFVLTHIIHSEDIHVINIYSHSRHGDECSWLMQYCSSSQGYSLIQLVIKVCNWGKSQHKEGLDCAKGPFVEFYSYIPFFSQVLSNSIELITLLKLTGMSTASYVHDISKVSVDELIKR